MIHVRAVQTRCLAPTNHRGARVVAKILGSGKRFVQTWDYSISVLENHQRVASLAMYSLRPWKPGGTWLVSAIDNEGYVFMVSPPPPSSVPQKATPWRARRVSHGSTG